LNLGRWKGVGSRLVSTAGRIRAAGPKVRVILRADSGFARESPMAWREASDVDYLFCLAKNGRLNAELAADLCAAAEESEETGKSARRFKDFVYKTRDSWSHERRVAGKAEWMTPSKAEADDMTQRENNNAKKKKRKKACLSGCHLHPLNVGCAHSPEYSPSKVGAGAPPAIPSSERKALKG
jgi:hypothetical protein